MKKAFNMYRFGILILFVVLISTFSYFLPPPDKPSVQIKKQYLENVKTFINDLNNLQEKVNLADESQIKIQFLKTRDAYKRIESFTEFFYKFYATRFNGPPIPFFEDDEPDILINQPVGLQVIESLIYPKLLPENRKLLMVELSELLRLAIELPTINESFAFNDNNIFEAVMEDLYRLTVLGITGFDSQVAQNGLVETAISLENLKNYLSFYKDEIDKSLPGQYGMIMQYCSEGSKYLRKSKSFNSFNRMEFIQQYLNPLTKIIGEYRKANGYINNPSGRYYSSIDKNNTLFNPNAFDVNRFLDDFTSSPEKILLGKKLFFENQLSSNGKRSCASCHQPGKAFTDGLKTSVALDGHSPLPRNAPTIWNSALQRTLFYDNRGRNLEDQVMQVLNNSLEMHGSAEKVAKDIILQKQYIDSYKQAYPNASVDKAAENICNAIACYERTLIALNSRFDQHMNGKNTLTKKEINGFNLFMGKAKCGTCHFMPLFSGAKPPRYYYIESEVIGVPMTKDKRPKLDPDSGRYLITGSKIHMFSFKTPTLRNVELTAPYMHNGVFDTLEEVLEFYNNGGGFGLKIGPDNQSLPFEKLNLTRNERKDIISFMKALTDTVSSN